MDITTKLCDHDVVRDWKLFGHFQLFYGKKSPTWTALFKVLRELDSQELSKQVEEFLARMFGLMAACRVRNSQHNKIKSKRVHGVQSSEHRSRIST